MIARYYKLVIGILYFIGGAAVVFGFITQAHAMALIVIFLGAEKFAQHATDPISPTITIDPVRPLAQPISLKDVQAAADRAGPSSI